MLHTSAQVLCVLQIPNIAWALNANQMLLWLLVMCCAINRKRATAQPSKCIANTKWMQTPGTPMLTTTSWARCNQPSSNDCLKAHGKGQGPQVPRALQTPDSAAAPSAGTPRVTNLPRVMQQQPGKLLAAGAERAARGMKAALPAGCRPHGSPTPGCVGSCLSLGERQLCRRAGGAACAGVLRACYFIFTCPIPLAQLSATREGKIDAKRDINLSWSVSPAAQLCQPSSRDALHQPSNTCN